MPRFDRDQARHEDLIEVVREASRHIATAIKEGFIHMADVEAQALADLQSAVTDLGTAIAAELVALQAAMNAQGVNNSPAIETSVSNIRNMIASLKTSASGTPPTVAGPAVTSLDVTSGPVAGGTTVTLTGTGFTGASAVTFSGIPAASFRVVNDTTITAVTPPGALGTSLPVLVTTPAGVSSIGPTWSFV
jgi:hypothetical protein